MKRVLLLGGNGQLGKCLQETIPEGFELCEKDQNRVDLLHESAIAGIITRMEPDILINCAAFNKVDDAEDMLQYTFRVNGLAPIELYDLCRTRGRLFVHVSSDFIFNSCYGDTIFREDVYGVMPPNVYGFSKLISDWALNHMITRQGRTDILLVRTSWLYSEFANNFLTKMIKKLESEDEVLGADDVTGSPTYARDLASAIWRLLSHDKVGVWHISNSGDSPSYNCVSKYDFIKAIAEAIKVLGEIIISPVYIANFNLPAVRAKGTALYCDKLVSAGLGLRHWKEALKDACERYKGNIPKD